MIPKFVKTRLLIVVGALLVPGVSRTALAAGITVDFNTISDVNAAPFHQYTESGITVSSTSGAWLVDKIFGDPTPYIYFNSAAGSTTTASIAVGEGGSNFSFNSIDLYSSTTIIPYSFTGFHNGDIAFSVSGTVPNTYGSFALVTNPDSDVAIDMLEVRLTDPAAPCCSNPMGLDNITVVPAAASVPEPGGTSLLMAGLATIGLVWRKMRS